MRLRSPFALLKDSRGATAIEFAFMAPIIIVIVIVAVSLFTVFRDAKIAEKSNFTVADIIARRTTVSSSFLLTTYQLFQTMTGRNASNIKFRVSSLVKKNGAFSIAWTYAVSPQVALTTDAIPTAKLPLVTDGDSLILVETEVTPPSIETFLPFSFSDYTDKEFSRPRFTSAVSKTD